MAFEEISKGGKGIAATKLAKGDSVTGYVMRIEERAGKFGPQTNLIMMDPESRDTFPVYTGGTLQYDAKEGRIKVGLLTRITAMGKEAKKSNSGNAYSICTFKVEQDSSDTVPTASNATPSVAETALAGAIKSKRV